jgi:methyl-accepting chemotaxis protein
VPISETLATIENILDKDVKLKRERATKNSNLVVKEMIIIGITSIIVLLLFMFWFSRKMNSTFKDFGEQMSRTISKVINASNELASASQELSQGTHEQAAFIQETAASIDELIAMVNKNTESAKHSAESSAEGQADAKIGMKVVDEMVSTFDILDQGNQKVFEKINESNLQLTLIVNLINEIGNKTKMINEIVFQTKLLSFNASVEAQRAGEHGKGFAIVAQEVGNLAESSRKASLEITHLLTDSTKKVNDIINQMKNNFETASIENKRQLESGLSTVSDCKVALNKIVDNVTVTKTLAEEISHASVEQQKGVSEISKSINHFDQINHQNAISADSLASVANLLLVESKGLNELVVDLEKVLNG